MKFDTKFLRFTSPKTSFFGNLSIDHFTVVSLVAWPPNESEAAGDLALIETSLRFLINYAVLMLISRNLQN